MGWPRCRWGWGALPGACIGPCFRSKPLSCAGVAMQGMLQEGLADSFDMAFIGERDMSPLRERRAGGWERWLQDPASD